MNPALSHLFRAWLWLTTGIITREWIAVHRKHHARVESCDDPHSPQQVGILSVLFGGLLLYQRAARDSKTLRKYGFDAPNDRIERGLYKRFPNFGLALMLAIDLIVFGPLAGAIIYAVQLIWIPFWAAGVINGLGHYFGYRNYEVTDASRNIVPWGLLVGGEELHNNHHAFPQSARFSTRRFEIDLGWIYIKLLNQLRMTKIHRIQPIMEERLATRQCDNATLQAFLVNRFEILAEYAQHVVSNVVHEERLHMFHRERRQLMRQAGHLMRTETLGLNPHADNQLQKALSLSPKLQTVYQMKQQLQQIWTRSTDSSDVLVHQLEDWCRAAEHSGIQALEGFSERLRTYRLVEV
jgi:stearoyl-CoA desaturase (delta-9 desaturase)